MIDDVIKQLVASTKPELCPDFITLAEARPYLLKRYGKAIEEAYGRVGRVITLRVRFVWVDTLEEFPDDCTLGAFCDFARAGVATLVIDDGTGGVPAAKPLVTA